MTDKQLDRLLLMLDAVRVAILATSPTDQAAGVETVRREVSKAKAAAAFGRPITN